MAEATGLRMEELGLFTHLYQLTMAQSYFAVKKGQDEWSQELWRCIVNGC
jgi:hypothetical protein